MYTFHEIFIGLTLDVFASQLFHDFGRENSWCESSPEDGVELVVKSSHPHLAEVPVWVDDGLPLHFALGLAAQHDVRSLGLFKHDGRVGQRYATADLNQMHISLFSYLFLYISTLYKYFTYIPNPLFSYRWGIPVNLQYEIQHFVLRPNVWLSKTGNIERKTAFQCKIL